MAVNGISYTGAKNYSGSFYNDIGKSVQSEASKQLRAGKEKFAELSSQAKKSFNDTILSLTFGTKASSIPTLAVPSKQPAAAPQKRYEAPSSTVKQEANTVAAGNTVTNSKSTAVTVTGGTGNTVQSSTGWASRGNAVSITGSGNTVDIKGKNVNNISPATFDAVGGAAIRENTVNVTGKGNSVHFSGQNINQNAISLTGNSNQVDIGNGVKNTNIEINANNVSVAVKENDPLTKSQNQWNVTVNVSDVNVVIENGKATVTGAGATGKGVKVTIDNETRAVTVMSE